MKLPVYNQSGEQIKDIELDPKIFNAQIKPEVIHQVVVAQQANARQVLAHTKDRSEVRGGGAKPWRQKGLGRARHGSRRSPIWVGGGVTFGPTKDRNFTQKVNQKQKQLALAMCLSDRAGAKSLVVFDQIGFESGKTKDLTNWLKLLAGKLELLKDTKKYLLVLDGQNKDLVQAAKNLKNVTIILADSLNCISVLNHEKLLITEKALDIISKHYRKVNQAKKQ